MGVFKNIRDLQKQAREIEREMPPAADRMSDAQARMANLSQTLAAQTQAANAALAAASGMAGSSAMRRTVTITGYRQIGVVNFDLLVEFDLTVLSDDAPPYPATAQQTVSQMQVSRLRPGITVQAAVDPANPAAIWLDLAALG